MEFLRSLLTRRFARAQVATSGNVGCLLRVEVWMVFFLNFGVKMRIIHRRMLAFINKQNVSREWCQLGYLISVF